MPGPEERKKYAKAAATWKARHLWALAPRRSDGHSQGMIGQLPSMRHFVRRSRFSTALCGFAWSVPVRVQVRRLAIVTMAILPHAALAALAADQDWPCTQARQPTMSLAAAWTGPSIEPYLATWSGDPDVAGLAHRLSQRRLSPEQAEREIRAFAGAAGAERRERLLALEAGVFSTLAAERSAVMDGLDRYGRRQKELAADIRADLETLRAAASSDPNQLRLLQQKVEWETRLLEQRRQSISAACDVPTRIEQRLSVLTEFVQPLVE